MEQINAMLDDLETQVNEGKKVPLTNQYVINRENVLAMIQQIRDSLPEAIVVANRMLEKQDAMMESANNQYNNKIAEAESKARSLGLDSKQRAEKLVNDAQQHADELYTDAQRQAHDLVANAQRQAEDMVSNADRKAKELVSQTKIMVDADREATRILTEARAEAQRDRLAAFDHCDDLLKRAEDAAISAANELRDARMSFDKER